MTFAYDGMKEALKKSTLSPDMGLEQFQKQLAQIWRDTSVAISVQSDVQQDETLRNVYVILLAQAQSATTDFQWLGEPQLFYAPPKDRIKLSRLRHFWLLPTLLLLAFGIIWYSLRLNVVMIVLHAAALLGMAVYLLLSAWNFNKAVSQVGAMHAEQQIDPALVKRTLEKVAAAMDSNAASLYAATEQSKTPASSLDGIKVVKCLLDLRYSGVSVPDSAMTQVQIYLHDHNVKVVEYAPERENLFSVMPSDETATLRPAIVRNVRSVRNGTAVEEEILITRGVACVAAET